MIDDAVGEVVGAVFRHVGGFVVELTVDHVFSRHTARFFHGVGRRVIAVATLGGMRIPSSLRQVPKGVKPKPGGMDWFALWIGVVVWIALFVGVGFAAVHLL